MMIRNFRAYYKTMFLTILTYRSTLWTWFLVESLPLFILLLLWKAIYQDGSGVPNFSFQQIILYYLIAFVISIFTASHFEEWRVREIREGKVDMLLVKPLSYNSQLFFSHLADKSASLLIKLPLFLIFMLIIQLGLKEVLTLPALTLLPQIIVLLLFAFGFDFFLAYLIVLLGFWFENSEGLSHFRWAIVSILSGVLLPLSVLPDTLQSIAYGLPFKYMQAIPAAVILGQYTLQFSDYLMMGLTLLTCITLARFIWRRANYRYTSAGG